MEKPKPVEPGDNGHAADDCCSAKGGEIAALASGGRKRVLQLVLAINAVMFVMNSRPAS